MQRAFLPHLKLGNNMKKFTINLMILALAIFALGCSKKQVLQESKEFPVKVGYSLIKDVPEYIQTVGHMEAYKVVNIRAQVDGRLIKTYFTDGDYINKGDLLYLIDQRPYVAALKQAKGSLEESMANMMYAKRTAERNAKLVENQYISPDTFDNLVTHFQADQGVVEQNEAAVDQAEINLSYTKIYSPINGRAGENLVDDGNLILESSGTPLVTLNQISPICSTFFISEKDLPRIQRFQKERMLQTIVSVEDPKAPKYLGPLTFIDNAIDLSTGMVKMKATIENDDHSLWPNQFVQVKLILQTLNDAILIPFKAVETNAKGKYIFIVKGDQTVEMRQIEVGQMQGDDKIVVTKGLKGREKIVIEGQINLYNGAKIKVIEDIDEHE